MKSKIIFELEHNLQLFYYLIRSCENFLCVNNTIPHLKQGFFILKTVKRSAGVAAEVNLKAHVTHTQQP